MKKNTQTNSKEPKEKKPYNKNSQYTHNKGKRHKKRNRNRCLGKWGADETIVVVMFTGSTELVCLGNCCGPNKCIVLVSGCRCLCLDMPILVVVYIPNFFVHLRMVVAWVECVGSCHAVDENNYFCFYGFRAEG